MATANITIKAQVQQAIDSLNKVNSTLDKVGKSSNAASASMDRIEGAARRASSSLNLIRVDSLVNLARQALGAVGSITQMADVSTQVTNKLKTVTSSNAEAAAAFKSVADIALKTGSNVGAVGDLFQKVAMAGKVMGLSLEDARIITENFTKTLAVTGTTGPAAASAIYQFGQALGRGVVAFEDMKQLQESSAGTLELISRQFGKTTAQFLKDVQAQKVGSQDLAAALKQIGQDVDPLFKQMQFTVGQSMENLRTQFVLTLGEIETRYQIFSKLANAIKLMGQNFDKVVPLIAAFGGAWAGMKIAGIVLSLYELVKVIRAIGTTAAVATALATGGLAAIGAAAGAAAAYLLAEKMFGDMKDDPTIQAKIDEMKRLEEQAKQAGQQTRQTLTYQGPTVDLNALSEAAKLYNQQYQFQASIAGMSKNRQEQEQAIYQFAQQQKVTYDQIDAATKTSIRDAVAKVQALKEQTQLTDQIKRINADTLALGIQDVNEREIKQAILAKELELQRSLTAEERARLETAIRANQAAKDANTILEARRKLAGEMTKYEALQRGISVQQRLDAQKAAEVEYKMDMDALQSHLDNKLISEADYQSQLLRLKKEYANKSNELYIQQVEDEKRQREIAIQAEQMRLGKTVEQAKTYAEFMNKTEAEKAQWAIQQGSEIFTALGAQNKKAFEAAKAFNIANAIMNTYMSVTKALASYPPPFNFIAAGAALTFGLAQVAQIRSQQYSGRALGGPVMGNQSYMVGENGPELFTPSTTGRITRNSELGGQAVNITFNISAVDASGVDDLLLQRRGLITQMVSDAMVERGQRSII